MEKCVSLGRLIFLFLFIVHTHTYKWKKIYTVIIVSKVVAVLVEITVPPDVASHHVFTEGSLILLTFQSSLYLGGISLNTLPCSPGSCRGEHRGYGPSRRLCSPSYHSISLTLHGDPYIVISLLVAKKALYYSNRTPSRLFFFFSLIFGELL